MALKKAIEDEKFLTKVSTNLSWYNIVLYTWYNSQLLQVELCVLFTMRRRLLLAGVQSYANAFCMSFSQNAHV